MVSGGAERQLTYLAAEQHRQGHDVHVALLHGGPNLERLRNSGARLHFIRARGNHDPRIVVQLIRLIRQYRPDITQTWLTQMDVLGGVAAALCRVPWVLSERSSGGAYPPTTKNWLRSLVGAYANAVVTNSAGGSEYWRSRIRRTRLLCEIPNPLPLREIDETLPATDAEMKTADGERVVLVVGRLAMEKNLTALIPALAIANERTPFVVRICGEGDERPIRQLLATHGLDSRVSLVGYVSRIWAWMKRADVYISVSHFEGRSNTALEAAACGCPLVLSDIPSHREVFDQESAWLVNPGRPHEIGEAIIAALAGDGRTEARRRRAQQRARGVSLADVERRYDDVYRAIVAAAEARV
jgi:glycosyltransferase involved in cell wall biosynthesis